MPRGLKGQGQMNSKPMIYVRQPGDVEAIAVPHETARARVLSHELVLSTQQDHPPFWLLEDIRTAFDDLSKFGPRADTPQTIRKIQEGVIHHGVLQDYAEGSPIPWMRNYDVHLARVFDKVLGKSPDRQVLLNQAERVLSVVLNQNRVKGSEIDAYERAQPDEEVVARSINNKAGDEALRTYSIIGGEWRAYKASIIETRCRIWEAIFAGFAQARILLFDGRPGQTKLISYDQVEELMREGRASWDGFYSVFTSDLPQEWFVPTETYAKSIGRASRWMDKVYAHFEAEGRRPTVADMKAVAMETFGLTQNGADRAWSKASSKGLSGGNLKASLRVNINEIRALE